MRAWVSPPHPSVSHMVEVAAIIAQAASTALPPFWKVIAPAVAASGLPVTAIQWLPCSGGFWVFEIELILFVVYTPWGNALFGTAPVEASVWLFVLPFAIAMLLLLVVGPRDLRTRPVAPP